MFSTNGQQHTFCNNFQVKSTTDIQQISENLPQSFGFGQRQVAPARATKPASTGAPERPTKKTSKAANIVIGGQNEQSTWPATEDISKEARDVRDFNGVSPVRSHPLLNNLLDTPCRPAKRKCS
ncbi:hypothetical protein BPOR_0242g00100 [Botrytis porri]|uniref:Uncharacterized protein n=2 Tax=Botrytis porri TaxID=87229 RepID=A0A4Z1KQV8_9HELO|nr:hypothetical protein BPOR_0242g00100 [Botrytis porri]